MHEQPNPTETAPPPIAIATMPPELAAKGWKLRHLVREGKWRARNDTLKLYPSVCETAEDAITSARELDSGKTQTLTGNGLVKFVDPDPPGSNGEMIRCPACGNPEGLESNFEGKKLVSFTCPNGHTFGHGDPKASGKDATKRKSSGTPVEAPTEGNFQLLPRKAIDRSSTNARQIFDETKLQELADSIRSKGILEPLMVRPKGGSPSSGPLRFQLVAGERRLRAAAIAGLDLVPCIVRMLTDKEAEEIQTIENDQREDLNPIERGLGYMKLIERHGHTPETLAAAVNKSKTFIYDQIKLAKLPELARKALIEGNIPQSTATLIARIPSEQRREKAAIAIITPFPGYGANQNALSFRDAKSLIERKFSLQLKGAVFNREDATLVPAAGACTNCPKLTGNNRVEFPDARADVCTDPQCFNQKVAAHDARLRAAAKDKEIPILPASVARRIFSDYSSDGMAYNSPYIDLGKQCPNDPKKNKRSYKQLLGEHAKPTLAINPRTHKARHVMLATDVAKILEKEHKIKPPVANTSRSSAPKKDPKAEAKRQLERDVFERATQLAGEEIATQAEVSLYAGPSGNRGEALKQVALLMFDNALMQGGDGDTEERIAIRLGLISPPKKKSPPHQSRNTGAYRALETFIKKKAPGASAELLFALALELEFLTDVYGNKLDERQLRIFTMFPRVGKFETYLAQAREELTKPADVVDAPAVKAKAAGGRGK